MLVEIPNFLSHEECDKLIERIDESNTRSSVAGSGSDQSKYDVSRTSSTSNLGKEELSVLIQTRIAKELNIDLIRGEDLQGQKYEPGQYFRPHNDFFEGDSYTNHCLHSGNRTHTFMIYLNDDFEGGETNFPNLGTSVKPEKGKAVWWYDMKDGELQRDTLHEGSDVISGSKYIVTSWWREKPWNNALDTQLASVHHRNTAPPAKTFSNWEDLPKIDPVGFKVVKVPEEAWSVIQEMYAEVKERGVEEKFDGKESIIPIIVPNKPIIGLSIAIMRKNLKPNSKLSLIFDNSTEIISSLIFLSKFLFLCSNDCKFKNCLSLCIEVNLI